MLAFTFHVQLSSLTPTTTTKQPGPVKASGSSRKNTEIVAPTRRELNDLNTYLLSVAESTKQQNGEGHSQLAANCFELDALNFQENQRSCWPVRPIPRRKTYKEIRDIRQATSTPNSCSNNISHHPAYNSNSLVGVGTNLNPAAIGVVIPTTPNSSNIEEPFSLNRNCQYRSSSAEVEPEIHNQTADVDFNWDLVQYFLSSTLKNFNKASVDRAQSVTSIHTVTSEANTPTYEELQTKLEASARNMQSIKDQQEQLLRLQQAAKQHLNDMESIRSQHTKDAHFNQNGPAPPDYESVEQVREDMDSLVSRMKSLTTFIQNQNELSNLLGEDSPDILAEQLALQKKLEDLKAKKQDMQNLISELQEINTSSERFVESQQNQADSEQTPHVVPNDFQRVVPIELVGSSKQNINLKKENASLYNGLENCLSNENHVNGTDDVDSDGVITDEDMKILGDSDVIRQKCADINAMKQQLKRLKDMMDTVKLIEEKAEGKSAREIADEAEHAISHPEQRTELQRDNIESLIKADNESCNEMEQNSQKGKYDQATRESEDRELAERVRVLQEMKLFVQDQVSHLAAERDRIKSIKDEIQKRRDTREDSVGKLPQRAQSPKRVQTVTNPSKEIEKDLLKIEYEAKKKEFEKICQRLEEDEEVNKDRIDRIDRARESVERHAEQVKTGTENMMYFSDNWDRNPGVSSSSSMQGGKAVPLTPIRGKESADSGAADVHGVTSIEARSFQSGCSSGFSGRAFNTRGTDNPQFGFNNFNSPRAPPAPQWNSNCYYQLPFAQQFSPHCHHPPAIAPNTGNAEFFCSQQCHNNGGVSAVSTANPQQAANVANSLGVSADPVLLQQFIQTQQMLINSVYQCNQLLWHQQREINNLNKTVLLLQERLKISNLTDSNNLDESRIEGQVPNGIFCGNRAQSEPRHPAPLHAHQYQSMQPPLSPIRQFHAYNYNNSYHHQRRNMNNLQQSVHAQAANSSYNFSHADTNMCAQMGIQGQQTATFNNATLSQPAPSYLNNDSPQAGSLQNGAPPIFMHHHNNTITPNTSNNSTNNSNLVNLHQNCLNSPSTNIQSTSATGAQIVPNSNNAAAAAAALNNQVPPGNRANNYWDNFRSYSRQNLLSTNSCKSNEDQSLGANTAGHNTRSNQFNPNRNLQHLNVVNFSNAASNLSNLPPSAYESKYFHTFRNEIGNNSTCPPTHVGMIGTVGNNDQSNMLHALGTNNDVGHNINAQVCPEQLQNYNIMDNQLTLANANDMFNTNYNSNNHIPTTNNYNNISAVATGVQDTRNMNFNYEINELKKKIPYKTTCTTKRAKHSSSALPEGGYTNQNVISQPEANIAINTNLENATAPQLANQRRSIDENLENPAVSVDNSTMSNELKRNLLENALKNDKFTMKFFESLKEDVYQEVYSIIKATESQPHHLVQLFKELQLVPSADPIRNIVLQAMHDLYKRSCANSSDANDSQESARRSCSENSPLNASGSTSTSCNSRENVGRNSHETKQSVESNSCEIVNSLINSDELKRVAYKIMFESSSAKVVEKGNKKNSSMCDAEAVKLKNELFRPDAEMVQHIMNNIRNAIATQIVDDTNIIRIAKLTCSSVENVSSPTNSSQNERILLSPKMLYRVMKSFENRDREAFFSQYETYLNTLFVIKSTDEDINLINKKCRECPQGGFTLNSTSANTNDDMQHLRKITPPSKSNISMNNSLDLGMDSYMIRKGSREEVLGPSSVMASNMAIPASYMNFSEQNNNSNSSQPPDLITTADVAMLFGGTGSGSYSTDQQESSPCNNNNVMNEDLAEADQICSNNTLNSFNSNRERINNETEQANSATINVVENNNQQNIDECQANNADEMSFSDSKAEEDSFETIDNNAVNVGSSGRQTQDSSDEIMMVVPTTNENVCNDPDDVSCVLIMPMEGSAAYNNAGNEASGSNNYIVPPKQRSIP